MRQFRGVGAALALTVALYALWGMAHNLNDILITQFKKAFSLTDLQSSLVQSCFYVAYLLMPLPVALFLQRYGYKQGVIAGLCLYALGALLFWPAAQAVTYPAFLGALFVIACGLTFLETAGTGIVVTLGSPSGAERRINTAQAFNPIGAITGVLVGRQFIFSGVELSPRQLAAMTPAARAAWRAAEARAVQLPYLCIALVVLGVAGLVAVTRFPNSATRTERGAGFGDFRRIVRSRHFVAGVAAQFFYVGAQIGVWSFLIRYVQFASPGVGEKTAALVLTSSIVLFLIGRFVSLALLRRFSSAQIGAVFAACAVVLAAFAIAVPSVMGIAALAGVSFFMSVMFPAIYAIGLQGNEAYSKPASALMVMSIVGGAVLTAVMGAISDRSTIALAYAVPFVSFLVVLAYCVSAVRRGQGGSAAVLAH